MLKISVEGEIYIRMYRVHITQLKCFKYKNTKCVWRYIITGHISLNMAYRT